MSTPQLPHTFAGASGDLALSQFDDNFAYLLGLVVGLNASTLPFDDTVGLGAETVQAAIVALFERMGSSELVISGAPPAGGVVGALYLFTPIVSGGTAPYTFAQTGDLPAEFGFNATTGQMWAILATAGTYSGLGITVTDSAGHSAQLSANPFTITIVSSGSTPGTLDFSDPDESGLIGH